MAKSNHQHVYAGSDVDLPFSTFENEALLDAAVKMVWEARRAIKQDARQADNLIEFCRLYFERLPHVTKKRICEQINKWVETGELD